MAFLAVSLNIIEHNCEEGEERFVTVVSPVGAGISDDQGVVKVVGWG